jgi:uncharacterized protein (TIGR02284 family)
MATTVGTESDLNQMLEKLIELDYDAAEAYDAAIERVEDATAKSKLEEFRNDHLRHTENLGEILRESGRQPPKRGDIKRVLTKGKVALGSLAGDEVLLKAMKTNEDDTNEAYERAVNHPSAPATVKDVLRSNLADERRHREWIETRLQSM